VLVILAEDRTVGPRFVRGSRGTHASWHAHTNSPDAGIRGYSKVKSHAVHYQHPGGPAKSNHHLVAGFCSVEYVSICLHQLSHKSTQLILFQEYHDIPGSIRMLSRKASPWQDAHDAAAQSSNQLRRSPDVFDRLKVDKLCLRNLGCLLMSSITGQW
jgi:hypothetical protein